MRVFPEDGQDLNRVFPGSSQGTASQKHIHTIAGMMRRVQPDLVLDLHTDSGSAIPYVLLDRAVDRKNIHIERSLLSIAKVSGLTPVWEYPLKAYLRFGLDKTLSGFALNQLGVPSLTLEVGPRRRMDPSSIRISFNSRPRFPNLVNCS